MRAGFVRGRTKTRDRRILAGGVSLAVIVLLVGGAFAGLAVEGIRDFDNALAALDSYLARIVWFTLWQAILSTVFSVIPAIAVARALSRHQTFPGRALILRLFALPLALPAIVATLGILALLGRAGLLAQPLSFVFGGTWPGIYGLSGILVAHVFFNLPLATRLLLEALDTLPQDQWRLASQLGMGPGPTFRLIEWPALRSALPGAAGLVFMLCVTSFTVVLTLGGGPGATTLEVAIYQSLRFDFDPTRAVTLTVLQIGLTVAVIVVLGLLGARTALDGSLPVAPRKFLAIGPTETAINTLVILLALASVAGPIAAVLIAGFRADLARLVLDPAVHEATTTSIVLAVLSSSLSVAMALSLVAARRAVSARRGWLARLFGWIAGTGAGFVLVVPPIVIGAGWFIMLRHSGLVFAAAPVMVVMVNAVMAMPFAIRAIRPAYEAAGERNDRLCAQLGIAGWNRARLIDWPALRLPMATGLAFSMALSLGDLGVIALFGSDSVQTLPYLLLARIGSYRTDDAAGLALLLGLLCLSLIFLADRLGARGTS